MQKKFLMFFCLCATSAAHAQTAGSWLVQGGFTRIAPQVSSGDLSAPSPPGTQVDVDGDTRPTAQLTYIHDRHWAIALPLGTGFKHKLYGAGAISNTGQIGAVSALPISLFGQYRFGKQYASIRPYAMLGLSYAYFHDAKGSQALSAMNPANPVGGKTDLKVDASWAISPGLGVSMQLDEEWFMDVSWAKTFLKTSTTLSTGQQLDTRLNPDMYQLGIGRRF